MFNRPCNNFNTSNSFISTSKSKKNRYITTDELIAKTLTPSTLKIYTALRFEVDFKKDVASVKITAQEIAEKAGVGRTTAFKAFNELESNGLLQRQETRDRRNTFWIAKELGYFTKVVQEAYHEQPNTSVQNVNGTVQNVNTYQYSYPEYINKGDMLEAYEEYADWKTHIPTPVKSDYHNKHADNNQTNKKTNKQTPKQSIEQRAEEGREICLNDEKCRQAFDDRFSEYEVEYEDLLRECFEYWLYQREQVIYPSRWLKWIETQDPKKQGYRKKRLPSEEAMPTISSEEQELMTTRRSELMYQRQGLKLMNEQEREKADELLRKYAAYDSPSTQGAGRTKRISTPMQVKSFLQSGNLFGQYA